jgi:hypothetical protein
LDGGIRFSEKFAHKNQRATPAAAGFSVAALPKPAATDRAFRFLIARRKFILGKSLAISKKNSFASIRNQQILPVCKSNDWL